MWEVPRYRIRAYLRSLRTSKQREKLRLDRRTIHYKRVSCELRIGDGFGMPRVMPARAVLNDISVKGIRVFTSMAFEPGTTLALTIDHPRYFFVRARVRACHELPYDSRILSSTPFNYRLHLAFEYATEAERAAVDSYCRQLFNEFLYTRSGEA